MPLIDTEQEARNVDSRVQVEKDHVVLNSQVRADKLLLVEKVGVEYLQQEVVEPHV